MALTLRILNLEGQFVLEGTMADREGGIHGTVKPSVTHPGYVTLLFEQTVRIKALRVPIDFVAELERLGME